MALNGLIELPAGSGTTANALARLDDWIQTADGGWVQKRHIVEVRIPGTKRSGEDRGTETEYAALDAAAERLVLNEESQEPKTPAADVGDEDERSPH
jgi:hypothetical protein